MQLSQGFNSNGIRCMSQGTRVSRYPVQVRMGCACSNGESMIASSVTGSASFKQNNITLHLLRHGETEMNVYLKEHDPAKQRGEEDSFQDPFLYDTKLTEKGKQEAQKAATEARRLREPPNILISSPLTRALQTADLTFGAFSSLPRLVHSLARERTYFASDVGVRRSELQKLWPEWSFDGVQEEVWWLDHASDKSNPKAVIKESEEHFQARMRRLQEYLASRPEHSIAVVAHRDVIESLAARSPTNCEFATIQLTPQGK